MNSNVALSLAVLATALAGCQSLDRSISQIGYTPIRPPQTIVAPGSIIRVTSARPLKVATLCTPASAYTSALKVEVSDAATYKWSQTIKSSFDLEAKYKDLINAELGQRSVRSVDMTLANGKVLVLPDVEISRAVIAGATDPACQHTVAYWRGRNVPLSIVSEVLQADVTFTIIFESDVSADVQAKITKDIAPKLLANVGIITDNTVQGEALFWGVRDAPELVELYTSGQVAGPLDEEMAAAAHRSPSSIQGLLGSRTRTKVRSPILSDEAVVEVTLEGAATQ